MRWRGDGAKHGKRKVGGTQVVDDRDGSGKFLAMFGGKEVHFNLTILANENHFQS